MELSDKLHAQAYLPAGNKSPAPIEWTTLTNKNDIHDEIKNRLNSGNACYHSVQNLLSSRLISKNVKIKVYKTVILPVCTVWVRNLVFYFEGGTQRVFENRVLRRTFGPKREEDRS
jgi:hypothetical protein